ncbi:DUF3109 family protein [Flavobacterium sp. CS20]|uniref:DUF3109 family protein n=1 Tax=Flavobacterium sp. CS20 TaxID=2775246 RepID=UPI001B3A053F|nr:DUF3109 family protein [Flavobacterium sp. CS20]QTY26387.1 DUF3109 family protein [Flavobacterium sp. CS20]
MFQIQDTLVSEEILDEDFTCNLSACKGECCVAGDAGAPIENHEKETLEKIYPKIKSGLRPEGQKAIEEPGTFVVSEFEGLETPLVNGKECAYVTFNEKGIALCGIEKAYREGKIDFKKPISCELYPVRVQKLSKFQAVNYHRWDICSPACALGKELQAPIYQFTKEALIKKFGQDWYDELEKIAQLYKDENL